jgi:hypothetical protein
MFLRGSERTQIGRKEEATWGGPQKGHVSLCKGGGSVVWYLRRITSTTRRYMSKLDVNQVVTYYFFFNRGRSPRTERFH